MIRAIFLALFFCTHAQAGSAACRLALAIGMDVSGSVDAEEYWLQREGLARALEREDVRAGFLAFRQNPVRLSIFEWAGPAGQRLLLDWTTIEGAEDFERISALLHNADRQALDRSTAIGSAMLYGAALLSEHLNCWRRTLDLSGDGPSDTGPNPWTITPEDLGQITINGLAIRPGGRANTTKDLRNVRTLLDYYQTFVMTGGDAFVEAAEDFDDFSNAMTRKLLRETQPPVFSHLVPPKQIWPARQNSCFEQINQ